MNKHVMLSGLSETLCWTCFEMGNEGYAMWYSKGFYRIAINIDTEDINWYLCHVVNSKRLYMYLFNQASFLYNEVNESNSTWRYKNKKDITGVTLGKMS